ncbi:hypothetical protein DL546_003258 [Coniochaeta pulveracea]|uniref:Methyltransferase domain-containing protein n=1 Tax=Coniochaeta pulveracea TaxID=177199 RepID=A0A420YEL2_9PEZI|nr:hypothetical protein DL546_003258 [Coniochaeta pulveracea]
MTSRESLPRILLLQHETFLKALAGRLLLTRLPAPASRVLDIGTGCGIWAADLAAEHPEAEVIGIDNFRQPKIQAPSNCRFLSLDAELPWDRLRDQTFDVIHTRLVPFHVAKIQDVLRRCYEHLDVNGVIEMQEMWQPLRTDEPLGAVEHDSKVIQWSRIRLEAAAKQGIDHAVPGRLPELLAGVGFVEVRARDLKWPIGTWMDGEDMKELGRIHLELLQSGMAGLTSDLLTNTGRDKEDVDKFIEQVRNELGSGKVYALVRVVSARKPGGSSETGLLAV